MMDFEKFTLKLNEKFSTTKGFHSSIIVPIQRLHMTVIQKCILFSFLINSFFFFFEKKILTLRLPTESMLNKAKLLLEDLSQEIYDSLDTRTAVVRFEGSLNFILFS